MSDKKLFIEDFLGGIRPQNQQKNLGKKYNPFYIIFHITLPISRQFPPFFL